MSDLKYCQGPKCHLYRTQDRIKGTKPNKTYQTRRRTSFYYGRGNFCDRRCMEDWIDKNIEQALNHFGRTTEAKHLTEQNAWVKTYDWNSNDDRVYIYHNKITSENRAITLEQYQDHNYTINE